MTLYHFCAERHVKQILRQGLTQGGLTEPTPTGFFLHKGWTWLTKDPDPNNQSWATHIMVKNKRTAWRLTIEIPNDEIRKLYDRSRIRMLYPACDLLFQGYLGSENWRVFHGVIPKEWIVQADKMEG